MKTCVLLLYFIIVIGGQLAEECFKSNQIVPESNLGAISLFPWLGLLMTHIPEIVSFSTAATGVALVKDRYGIAVASDIVKMPKKLLVESTRVMFIVENNLKWYVKINDYIVHPEQSLNIQAIVLLELETLYGEPFKVKPICWPKQGMEVQDLYSFEYVDDHNILQKRIKKMMYVDNRICYEFYERAAMKEYLLHARTICAYSVNSEVFCLSDNGHVLASNDSGYWVIIGLGMFGPSCAAPTRFINLQSYFKWIALVTTAHVNDKTSVLRSVLGVGFIKPGKPFHEQPLHETVDTADQDLTRRRMYYPLAHKQKTRYQQPGYYRGPQDLSEYAFGRPGYQKIHKPPDAYNDTYNDTLLFSVDQKKINELKLTIFSESEGNLPSELAKTDTCADVKNLQYREYQDFQGYVDGWNFVNYWVTIADKYVKEYTCIIVDVSFIYSLNSKISGTLKFVSYLYQSKPVDYDERAQIPEEIIRHKKLLQMFGTKQRNQTSTTEKPEPKENALNLNVLVNFGFKDKAVLEIYVYGKRAGEPDSPYKYLLKDTRRMADEEETVPFVHKEEMLDETDVARLFDVPDNITIEDEDNSTVQTFVAFSNSSSKVMCVIYTYLLTFFILFKQIYFVFVGI